MYAIPFQTTDWKDVPSTEHPGETGLATWRTKFHGNLRVRMVDYSPGYTADHWCTLGHLLFCLDGVLDTELSDGTIVRLTPGMSYEVSDGLSSHKSRTATGARLLIVDGGFLHTRRNAWPLASFR